MCALIQGKGNREVVLDITIISLPREKTGSKADLILEGEPQERSSSLHELGQGPALERKNTNLMLHVCLLLSVTTEEKGSGLTLNL